MALIKRGNIWYTEVYDQNGKAKRVTTGTSDRDKALRYQQVLKAEITLGIEPSRPAKQGAETTFRKAIDRFCLERATNRSIGQTRRQLLWFADQLPEIDLSTWAKHHTRRVKDVLEKKKVETTGANANRYMAAIRAVLRAAVEWEWMKAAPVFKEYKEASGRVRFLSDEEITKLLAALPPHWADIAAFCLATGVRRGAAINLTWDRVHIDKGFCWINSETSKNGQPICIPLNAAAIQILERNRKREDYVFTVRGKRVKEIQHKTWKKALAQAGISDFRFHDLRHTWASHHAMNGTPRHILKELGGWKTDSMVSRYAHLSPESLAKYAGNAALQ